MSELQDNSEFFFFFSLQFQVYISQFWLFFVSTMEKKM